MQGDLQTTGRDEQLIEQVLASNSHAFGDLVYRYYRMAPQMAIPEGADRVPACLTLLTLFRKRRNGIPPHGPTIR